MDKSESGRLPRRCRWSMWRRLGLTLVATSLSGVAVASCGGTGTPRVADLGSTTTATTLPSTAASSSGGPTYAQAIAYSQCMRQHAIADFPDPTPSGRILVEISPNSDLNPNSTRFISANAACEHLLPNNGQPTAAERQADIARLLRFSRCMRAHGLPNFPDPVVAGNTIAILIRRGTDLNPTLMRAAQNACKAYAPGG